MVLRDSTSNLPQSATNDAVVTPQPPLKKESPTQLIFLHNIATSHLSSTDTASNNVRDRVAILSYPGRSHHNYGWYPFKCSAHPRKDIFFRKPEFRHLPIRSIVVNPTDDAKAHCDTTLPPPTSRLATPLRVVVPPRVSHLPVIPPVFTTYPSADIVNSIPFSSHLSLQDTPRVQTTPMPWSTLRVIIPDSNEIFNQCNRVDITVNRIIYIETWKGVPCKKIRNILLQSRPLYRYPVKTRNSRRYVCLSCDDVDITYKCQVDATHFTNTIQSLYSITIYMKGSTYLGLTFDREYVQQHSTLSMSGYILNMI